MIHLNNTIKTIDTFLKTDKICNVRQTNNCMNYEKKKELFFGLLKNFGEFEININLCMYSISNYILPSAYLVMYCKSSNTKCFHCDKLLTNRVDTEIFD